MPFNNIVYKFMVCYTALYKWYRGDFSKSFTFSRFDVELKLSMFMIIKFLFLLRKKRIKLLPTKPAPPVTSITFIKSLPLSRKPKSVLS